MDQQLGLGSQPGKVERKLIEKNRRNQMKILYSKLYSLLPNYNPMELALPLPDQIEEAIKYIKRLEEKVKMAGKKKESFVEIRNNNTNKRSRTSGCCSGSSASTSTAFATATKSPRFEIHEIGSSLQVVLTCGLDSQFIFYEIIRLLHEDNVDIRSANSSIVGDSVIHVVHAEIPQSALQFGATKVSERLKRFVSGSSSDVGNEILQPGLWDFEFGTDFWGF